MVKNNIKIISLNHTPSSLSQLRSHTQHHFKQEVIAVGPVSHVKVVMAPDGGISRVRVLGKIINKL